MTSTKAPVSRPRVVPPPVRGPWTEALYRLLDISEADEASPPDPGVRSDPLADDDLQMALYLCYELHYAGLEGVDDRMEWSPLVLMLRSTLESELEAAIKRLVPSRPQVEPEVGEELQRL